MQKETITIYVEIPVEVEVEYSKGRSNKNSGEIITVNCKKVMGPPLDPTEPPEIEIMKISHPEQFSSFEDLIWAKLILSTKDSDLWEALEEK